MTLDGLQADHMPNALAAWLSAQAPALPAASVLPWAWHLSWAVVLAWLLMAITARLPRAWRWGLSGAVALWTLLPGAASPAQVLGLVWQAPSLVTVLLCGTGLLAQLKPRPAASDCRVAALWALCAVLLGWALLLDTLALLPVQLYAAGFSASSLLVAVLVLGLPWVAWGGANRTLAVCLLLALVVFAALRWPTGNLWDALLDPLLWLWLQARGLWKLLRYTLRNRSAPPAIRV